MKWYCISSMIASVSRSSHKFASNILFVTFELRIQLGLVLVQFIRWNKIQRVSGHCAHLMQCHLHEAYCLLGEQAAITLIFIVRIGGLLWLDCCISLWAAQYLRSNSIATQIRKVHIIIKYVLRSILFGFIFSIFRST